MSQGRRRLGLANAYSGGMKDDEKSLVESLLEKATFREPSTPRFLGDQANNNNDDAYPFTIQNYAMKYVGCQNIKSYDDDLAQDEDSETVLGVNRFVVFRLCNSEICSSYNQYGCIYDFGEYVISMDDYLAIMYAYHYSRYQEYCETCIPCMNGQDIEADDDGIYNMSNYDDDDLYNATNATDDMVNECQYTQACENYKRACHNYGQDQTTYEDFFECSEFNVGNNVGYLGPHCASDGYSIQIGIFEDENCQEYIGDLVDIESFTGMDFSHNGMSFYTANSCVSCLAEDEYSLFVNGNQANEVYQLCEVIYEASGKCNRYFDIADIDATYDSDVQSDSESLICSFVESLMENNYDEGGEIILTDSFDISKWKDPHEYTKLATEVTPFQAVMLSFSLILMLGLFIYACYLHRVISTKSYYTQNKSIVGRQTEAGKISRIQSGIMMGRSASSTSHFR